MFVSLHHAFGVLSIHALTALWLWWTRVRAGRL